MILRALFLLISVAVLRGEIVYKIRLSAAEGSTVVELAAERYVAAVLAGESGTFENQEALKAMAVAARSYAAYFRSRHAAEGYDFCSTTHCQRVILKDANGRYAQAAEATRGQLLWFQSKPAFTAYTRNCGGRSEAARTVWPNESAPYLIVHDDPYCTRGNRDAWRWQITAADLSRSLTEAGMEVPAELSRVVVLDHSSSGRVRTLSLVGGEGSKLISGSSFRFAIGRTLGWNTIRSEQYQVRSANSVIDFAGRGSGHGVGLCQEGAAEMAAEGKTYQQILGFYYPGASVSVLANDLKWKSLQGRQATVFAIDLNTARKTLRIVDEISSELKSRYGFERPIGLQIYVYPDLESYRNGTGEPGWVAAHTAGVKIETQPFIVLQQHGGFTPVMRHELLHATVESEAKPGLPWWFREGLVECLAGDPAAGSATMPTNDKQISKRSDAAAAHNFYRAAGERVAELRMRYSTRELLRWVKFGVPEAVIRSSSSKQPANSR